MALTGSHMKSFGVGERVRTVLFWLLAIAVVGIVLYFLSRHPTVWPQKGTIAQKDWYYETGEYIDTFEGEKQIAYPLWIQPTTGEPFKVTVAKEDWESVQEGQQVKWKKLPFTSIPSHDLKL